MTSNEAGDAYSFFYCNASKNEIEEELPRAKRLAKSPANLELILEEGIDPEMFDNSELKTIANENIKNGRNYTMIAVLPNATSERACGELKDVYNSLYASPIGSKFYKDGIKFDAEIVH